LLSLFSDSERRIANNVFVEILAESGTAGALCLSLMLAFWWRTVLRASVDTRQVFGGFAAGMFVAWTGYPTFNVTYLWGVLGLSLALALLPGEEWVVAGGSHARSVSTGSAKRLH
jgi:hypothetical protein